MKKIIVGSIVILFMAFFSYPSVLPFIVEHNLKKTGLITAKTKVDRTPYQITLKNLTFYIPLNQQELAVIDVPELIVKYSLSSMLHDKLDEIIIPVANIKAPFYFAKPQAGNVNRNIDYKGFDLIRPDKKLWIKQINIIVKDTRHNINGLIKGEIKITSTAHKGHALISSQWHVKSLLYKNDFFIDNGIFNITGKLSAKDKATELNVVGKINKTKLRHFAIDNFTFQSKVNLSDQDEKIKTHFLLEKLYIDIKTWPKNPLLAHGSFEYHQGLYGKLHFVDHERFFNGVILFNNNHYRLAVNSVDFKKNQVLFDKVVPGLNTDSMLVDGKLKIKGEGDIAKYPKTNIKVSGDNFQIEGQRLHVDNFDLDFGITQFYPLTITDGKLDADKIHYYFSLNNTHVKFDIKQPQINIKSLKTGFSGGQINLSNQHYTPSAYENDITLKLSQVQLGQLAKIINIDGLAGQCRMGGKIQFVILPNTVKVKKGSLKKQSRYCLIQYKPKKTPTSLVSNQNIASVMQYLNHLVVKDLDISLNTSDKGTKFTVNVLGKNPQMYEGIPIKLNLNVNGPLQAILTSIFIGDDTVRKVKSLN